MVGVSSRLTICVLRSESYSFQSPQIRNLFFLVNVNFLCLLRQKSIKLYLIGDLL
jgi:hypothetical protein